MNHHEVSRFKGGYICHAQNYMLVEVVCNRRMRRVLNDRSRSRKVVVLKGKNLYHIPVRKNITSARRVSVASDNAVEVAVVAHGFIRLVEQLVSARGEHRESLRHEVAEDFVSVAVGQVEVELRAALLPQYIVVAAVAVVRESYQR